MTARSEPKMTRMSIDVPLKDHRRIKTLASAEGLTIRAFIMECVEEKIYPERKKHPNKATVKAIASVRKGKAKKAKDFDDICNQLGI